MKLKLYEKYKQSGIDWIEEIPEDWEVRRVKDVCNSFDYIRIPLSGELRGKMDNQKYDYYGASGIIDKVEDYLFNGIYILIGEDGANLLSRTKPLAFLANGKFWVNNHAHIIKPKKYNNINYFVNALESLDYSIWVSGAAQPKLTQEALNNVCLYYPPRQTQTKIANYLDQKTAQIDKKINLLEQKLSKYEELKKTLINETVCRGLDKNVELKESGVEWIGKIPKYWEVKRVKDVFNIGRGRVIAQTELIENGKYPVYSSQTENEGCLGYINTFDFNKQLLTWTTDGVNAGTIFQRKGKFNCTNICGTLFPKNKKLNLNYQKFALQISATNNKRIDTNGAKIMNNEMKIIKIVFPPPFEQIQIANYLNEKCNKIDKIRTTLKREITLLKEFRKTLINDVVTGKVKVN